MKTTTQNHRTAYVAPAVRVKPAAFEKQFLATATIPEYEETEEDW
jgi:hypothetical protein